MTSSSIRRKPRAPRDLATLGMILTRKGGRMRDRRLRRPADARRQRESWQ